MNVWDECNPEGTYKIRTSPLAWIEFRMPRRARKTRQTPPCRRRCRGQRGGVSPALITGIFKTGHALTKAIGEHQEKHAEKMHRKRMAEIQSSKRKKYAGESFNCHIM